MANQYRVLSDFKSGTITNNPLVIGATSVDSAQFASLPAIGATQHMLLILDPLGAANGPECCHITAHSAAATTCTIVRAREGTSAAQHVLGTAWCIAVLSSDHTQIVADASALAAIVQPHLFQRAIQADIGEERIYYGPTTGWQKEWGGAWGRLASSGSPTGSGGIAVGGGGAEAVGLTSAAVTLVANRRIEISGYLAMKGSGVFTGQLRIRRGTTTGGTLLAGGLPTNVAADIFAGYQATLSVEVEDTGYTPGSIQYVITGSGGDIYQPSWLLVKDMGPAAAPVLT